MELPHPEICCDALPKQAEAECEEAVSVTYFAEDTAVCVQTDEVPGHPVLQEARLLGMHSLSQQGKRLISLHLKLIQLRCNYTQKFHLWGGELIAFSRALRGSAPESGGVKAALTSAGVLVRRHRLYCFCAILSLQAWFICGSPREYDSREVAVTG